MGKKAASTTAFRLLIAGSVVLVMCLIVSEASADLIVLKNGSRFDGKVLKETPEKIVLQTQFGAMEFQRDKVKEVIKRAVPKPSPPKAKPEGASKKPGPEAKPEKAEKKAKPAAPLRLGSRGRIMVVQRNQATSKNYVMNIKDAVAIVYKDEPNKMVEVSFLPFKLSEEDVKFLRNARGNEVASLVGRKSSPDLKYWEDHCPYASLTIKFAEGKERAVENMSECDMCFHQIVHPGEKASEAWKDRRAHQAVTRLKLYMEGREGTLEISSTGRFSLTRKARQPAETQGYTWSFNVKCRAFVK